MKNSRLFRIAVGLCVLLGSGPLPAGAPQARPTPGQTTQPAATPPQAVLRVTTRLVQVNVIVQDKNGDPVSNLTRDDFTLLEDGHPQQISVFSMENNRPAAVRAAARPALPPNTFTNRLEYWAQGISSLTAILFDGLNTKFEDQAYARQQIIRFIQQLQPEDRVAIYTLGRDLRLLHDFTSDTASLLRVLGRHKGNIATELAASEEVAFNTDDLGDSEADQQLREFLEEANETMQAFYVRNRVRQTLDGIEAVANHLSRLPGRKNVVWVSGSFPLTFGFGEDRISRELTVFSDDILRTARAVTTANVAIYPVDARGLIGAFDMFPDLSPANRGNPRALQTGQMRSNASKVWDSFATMNELAERTGGKAFYNSNDIRGAIRRAIDDSRVTYLLGYYPRNTALDSKFHEIRVLVRKKGLQVRHRRGYFAFPDPPRDEKHRQDELRIAAWSPLDSTGLGMTVHLAPQNAPVGSVRLEVLLNPGEVILEPKDGRWNGQLDMAFICTGADNQQLASTNQSIQLSFLPENHQLVAKNGMVLLGQMNLAAGTRKLRIIVRDVASGSVGSVTVPIERVAPPRNPFLPFLRM
jgi:VWFA-related protein